MMPTSRNGSAISSPLAQRRAHGREQLDDDEDEQQRVEDLDDGVGREVVEHVEQLVGGDDEEDDRG